MRYRLEREAHREGSQAELPRGLLGTAGGLERQAGLAPGAVGRRQLKIDHGNHRDGPRGKRLPAGLLEPGGAKRLEHVDRAKFL